MEKDFIKYLKGARAEFSREILKMAPHENPNRTEEQTRLRVVAEDILIAFDQAVEKLTGAMSNNTPNNTALTAEEKAEQLYPYPDFSRYNQMQEDIFTHKINNQRQAFVEGAKYSASALAEKDREIERLNVVTSGLKKTIEIQMKGLWAVKPQIIVSNEVRKSEVLDKFFYEKERDELRSQLQEAQKEIEELKRSASNPYNQHIKELTDAKIELLEKSNSILTKDLQSTRDMCERLGTAFGAVSEWAKCGVFHNCPRPDDYPEQHSVLNASLAVLNEFRRLKNQQSPSQEGEKTT